MRKKFLFICLFLLAWCSVSMASNVVVLDDSTDVVASLTDATITYRRELLIPDKKGKEAALWSYVMDKSHKLKNFSATFSDGKVTRKFKKGDLQRTELSSSLADDSYTYYLNYTPASYPFTVTYEWTVECHDGVIAYPMFCPIDGYDEQVSHASYTIRCTPENPCRYQEVRCESLQEKLSVVKREDGSVKATFDNLPAIKQEPYALPLYLQQPMVLFAPDNFSYLGTQGRLDTWANFGKWQYGLLEGRAELPDAIKSKVHEMTDALPTKREKIARLYQYLYDNTRYVSIQLGIGGYQPATASEVAANGFGDCKGLSNYMIALLREAGIPAIYVAISTIHVDLQQDFPNLNQLNHAIVAVPMEKDTLWLECTNARIPLGYIHDDIAGHEAILITSEGGKKVRLPQYADTDNVQESNIKMMVAANGKVQLDCQVRKTNKQYENVLPLLSMAPGEQKKVILGNMIFPAGQITKFQMEEDKGKAAITTMLGGSSDRYANVSGKRIFFKINPMKADWENVPNLEHRQTAFAIDYGYCDEEDIEISLPEGYRMESMPTDRQLENKFASFKLTFKQEGKKVHAIFHLVMHAGTYKASEYEEFVKTKNSIVNAYRQQVVLVGQ